ncbi:hypothetical protein BLNAU_5250 [Blattamonas nauphoetae]|uniref:Uncharacterized protein n=1 Tax=Blattamonas nauphoetae TaxID=2049346 RepID=A0ABQ9Y7P1_9EUKA|nr:hypothetical protein BLNAU_5250 [Blattamonas nauphoetae]
MSIIFRVKWRNRGERFNTGKRRVFDEVRVFDGLYKHRSYSLRGDITIQVISASAVLIDANTATITLEGVSLQTGTYSMLVKNGADIFNITLTRSDSTTLTGTAPLHPSTAHGRLDWSTQYEITKVEHEDGGIKSAIRRVGTIKFTTPESPPRIISADCSLGGDQLKSALEVLTGVKLGGGKNFKVTVRKIKEAIPTGGDIVLSGTLSSVSSWVDADLQIRLGADLQVYTQIRLFLVALPTLRLLYTATISFSTAQPEPTLHYVPSERSVPSPIDNLDGRRRSEGSKREGDEDQKIEVTEDIEGEYEQAENEEDGTRSMGENEKVEENEHEQTGEMEKDEENDNVEDKQEEAAEDECEQDNGDADRNLQDIVQSEREDRDAEEQLIVAEFEVQSDIKKIKLRISEITLFSRKIGFPRRNKPEEQDGQEEVFEDQQEYGKEEGNSFDSQPDKEPEHHSETNDNDDEIVKKEHFRETEGGEEGSVRETDIESKSEATKKESGEKDEIEQENGKEVVIQEDEEEKTACTLLRFDDCVSQNMIVMQHDIPVSHNLHQRVHHTFARGLLSSAQSDINTVSLPVVLSLPQAQPIPNNAEPSPPPQLPPQQKKQREVQFQPQFISQQPAEKMRQPERQKSSSGTDTTQLISDEEPNGLLKGQYMDVELWPMMRDPLDGGFTAPAFTIPSSAGLVAFHSLPDQIHVLCQDEDGIVSMWNILTGKLEETLGPGRLEDFAKRFPKPLEFRRKWYTAETKTGTDLQICV